MVVSHTQQLPFTTTATQTSLAGKKKVITGQYSTYNAEWLAENNKLDEVTDTATYAATLLQVDNGRWQGVPFVMEAGKKLEEKASYVRVVFKAAADATEKYLVFYVDGKMGQFIAGVFSCICILCVCRCFCMFISLRNT